MIKEIQARYDGHDGGAGKGIRNHIVFAIQMSNISGELADVREVAGLAR